MRQYQCYWRHRRRATAHNNNMQIWNTTTRKACTAVSDMKLACNISAVPYRQTGLLEQGVSCKSPCLFFLSLSFCPLSLIYPLPCVPSSSPNLSSCFRISVIHFPVRLISLSRLLFPLKWCYGTRMTFVKWKHPQKRRVNCFLVHRRVATTLWLIENVVHISARVRE